MALRLHALYKPTLPKMDNSVIEQMRSKTALVTGGTDGVGKEVARGLAERGARLVIVGRDAEKGARAERDIRASTKNSNVDFVQADLSLVREACRLGDEVAGRWSAIHYLVHSAGIVRGRRVVTAEGFESNFATNYLSRFALTVRLLSSLRAAGQPGNSARIVVVAAPGSNGTIHYDDVNLTKNFSTIRALKQYQHANDLFVVESARRLTVPGERPSVTISCLHPGVVTKTNIRKEFPLWMKLMVRLVADPLFSHTPDVPAAAALRLLLAEEFEGESGALFSVLQKFKRLSLPLNVEDPREGHRLWAFSEEVISDALGRQTVLASAAVRRAT
jgi:NAD(P)-dependent dehydrogenase (short-subunit alcohol dehydrogenase family)